MTTYLLFLSIYVLAFAWKNRLGSERSCCSQPALMMAYLMLAYGFGECGLHVCEYPGADMLSGAFPPLRRDREAAAGGGSGSSVLGFFVRLEGAALTGSGGVSGLPSRGDTLRFKDVEDD